MKKKFFVLLPLFLCISYASAEKINWETVVRQTLELNPSIQSSKLRLENAKYAYNNAISNFMPDLSLSGSATQRDNEGVFTRSYSYGLNAGLSIFSGFETYNDVRQKDAELKAAQAEYDREVSDAAYEVAVQYTNLMWSYETVDLLKQIKERRAENRDMITLKYNSGNVDIGSLRRVEADYELSQYDLRKAERYIETASSALKRAIGRNDDAVLQTEEKLVMSDRNIERLDFNTLIIRIPEFKIAQFNVDSYKAQSAKAKSVWWPQVSLSGGYTVSDSDWPPANEGWNAGLSISYSLFTGGRRYNNVQIASNNLEIAEESFKNTGNLLKYQMVNYFNNLTDAYENISTRENYLKASQLQAEISSRKYVNGLSTYQDWYSIENDYISSQKTFLDVKRTAALERAQWYNFIGEGFIQPGK